MRARLCGFLGVLYVAVASSHVARADTLEPGDPATLFTTADVVTGLTQPTSFAFLPDGRMIITEKGGDVILAAKAPKDAGSVNGFPKNGFSDTQVIGTFPVNTVSEQGLLHVILHPDFATNHLLIFYYSAANPPASDGTDADRHRVVTVPLDASFKLDRTQEKILVRGLRGPANHDGGSLAVSPDGQLYVGDGDTGCNSNLAPEPVYAPHNYFATCLTNPNGKILRVNLDGTIPTDNPLVGKKVTACGAACGDDVTTLPLSAAPRTDIWAWGFRNPWRFWFDPKTKNLWVGDVGEVTYEEIDVIPPSGMGKHYGWPWREAAHGHPASACQNITPSGTCVDPQYYCKHGAAAAGIDGNCEAITGGLIVDSCEFPASFRGLYFFGDNANSWIATLSPTADRNGIVAGSRKMFATSHEPVHIDVGPDGALYYAEIIGAGATSVIERVFPKNPEICPAVPPGAGGASGTDGSAPAGFGGTAATGAGGATSRGPLDASVKGLRDASLDGGGRLHGQARAGDTGGCGCHVASREAPGAPSLAALSVLGSRIWASPATSLDVCQA